MVPERFILHGISGVHNYGCEAIVRGTTEILRAVFPKSSVLYVSTRYEADRLVLADCPVTVVDNRQIPRMHPRNLYRGVSRRLGLPVDHILGERYAGYRPSDCVLSIGGDIFTFGAGPSAAKYVMARIAASRCLRRKSGALVLWGASVGPFDSRPETIPTLQEFLGNLELITAREDETVRYLSTLGIHDTVVRVGDPAFMMTADSSEVDRYLSAVNRPIIGINFSPLSVAYRYGSVDLIPQHQAQQAKIIARLIAESGAHVVLIPHVISSGYTRDDDYAYLHGIHAQLDPSVRDSVTLLPPDLGACRTKGIIAHCDMLIAARMHCAIAGISSATPTILVAYSSKAVGMAEYAYGHQQWCLDIDAITAEMPLTPFLAMLQQRQAIRQHLQNQQARFREMALAAGTNLAKQLERM